MLSPATIDLLSSILEEAQSKLRIAEGDEKACIARLNLARHTLNRLRENVAELEGDIERNRVTQEA